MGGTNALRPLHAIQPRQAAKAAFVVRLLKILRQMCFRFCPKN
jgi:hypothetical protein